MTDASNVRKSQSAFTSPSLVTLAGLLLTLTAFSGPLEYRKRDNRHEGVLPKPVSGWDIELIGAMVVDPDEPRTAVMPDELALYFFLEEQRDVHITVREQYPEEFYWLDKVEPKGAWRPRVANVFTWPSSEVLRQLDLELTDLVALVRLDRETPGRKEHVAPVSFQPVSGGSEARTYRFTFKVNARAKIGYEIYGASADSLASGPRILRQSDTPFDVLWKAQGEPEGPCRLLLQGYFLNDNTPIEQEVLFYHASSWQR